jgi:hypothetical protein
MKSTPTVVNNNIQMLGILHIELLKLKIQNTAYYIHMYLIVTELKTSPTNYM